MKKGKLAEIKAKFKDKNREIVDTMASQTRLKYADRWIERTRELGKPCDSWSEIDFSDYQISLEWKLCDPANIMNLQDPKTRDRFLATLSDAEREYLFSDPDAYNAFLKDKWRTRLLKRK